MCLEVGRVNQDCLVVRGLSGQSRHDPCKHPHIAPPLPPVVHSLGWAILAWRIVAAQPIAINGNNTIHDMTGLETGLAMALWKVGPQPRHLRLAQAKTDRS